MYYITVLKIQIPIDWPFSVILKPLILPNTLSEASTAGVLATTIEMCQLPHIVINPLNPYSQTLHGSFTTDIISSHLQHNLQKTNTLLHP